MSARIDLVGAPPFGRLTVKADAGRDGFGRALWKCRCRCGNFVVVAGFNLRSGHTTSCGCALTEAITKHGQHNTPEYFAWVSMLARCRNKKSASYKNYGKRGIRVCKRWRKFENFLKDMGPRPSPEHSLDRRNNDGDYEKKNCRWATVVEQAMNRQNTLRLTIGGQSVPALDVARSHGIAMRTFRTRLARGWTLQDAATRPLRKRALAS